MLKKMSVFIADKLITSGFDPDQREIIAYGAECTLSELLANIILILVAYLLHLLPVTLIWLVFFTALRVQVGGYHAANHTLCILESTIIGIVCSYFSTLLTYSLTMICGFLLIIFFVILKYAPAVHPNHPISVTYQRKLLHRSLIVFAIEALLTIMSFMIFPPVYATVMMNSIFSCVFLMILGLIGTKNIR